MFEMLRNQKEAIHRPEQKALFSGSRTGIPDEMRMKFERASGISLRDVRVFYHSEKPAELHADAYAQGNRVYIASGQERLLGHELAHVIQQSTQKIEPDAEYNGTPITVEQRYESEADAFSQKVMGLDLNLPADSGNLKSVPLPSESLPVQGSFQEVFLEKHIFSAGTKNIYLAMCDGDYRKQAKRFEYGMAPLIMKNDVVNRQADRMLRHLKRLVLRWCRATKKEAEDIKDTIIRVFGTAFADQSSEGFYGAIDATVENVITIFQEPSMPLRLKYRLIYNSIRNNNLTKWLKVLSIQYRSLLDSLAKGAGPEGVEDTVIKESETVSGKAYQDLASTVVRKEFIKIIDTDAGLKAQLQFISAIQQKERPGDLDSAYADVFGKDRYSSLFDFMPEQRLATQERVYSMDAASALAWQERRAANMIEPDDLTLMERRHSLSAGIPPVTDKHDGARRVTPWTQGREGYTILPSTETAKLANELKAGMAAGISGSTDLMFHAAQYLGFTDSQSRKTLRLGLAGWMIAGRDHSFFEVYMAAKNYGVEFHYNKDVIGSEYEDADNLYPMKKGDFAAILGGVFPGYFYSDDYLREVISNNEVEDLMSYQLIDRLNQVTSIDKNFLWDCVWYDQEIGRLILGHIYELYRFINRLPLGTRDFQKKNFAQIRFSYQKIKRNAHYIYIANTLTIEKTDRILTELLRACNAPLDMEFQLEQDSGEVQKALLIRQGLPAGELDSRRSRIDVKTRERKLKRLKFKQEILDALDPELIYYMDYDLEELRRSTLKAEAPDLQGAWAAPARLKSVLWSVLQAQGKAHLFWPAVEEYQKAAAILLYSKSRTDTERVEEFRKLQKPKQEVTSKLLTEEELDALAMPEEFGKRGDAVREEEYWGIAKGQAKLDSSSKDPLSQVMGGEEQITKFTENALQKSPGQPEKVLDALFGGMPVTTDLNIRRTLAKTYLKYNPTLNTWQHKEFTVKWVADELRGAANETIRSIVNSTDSAVKKQQAEQFMLFYHNSCPALEEAMETQISFSALRPKELGAIYQYTTDLYRDIIAPEAVLIDKDLDRRRKTEPEDAHEGEFGTLTTIEPLIKAASSGLSRLPVYRHDVYRIVEGAQMKGLTGAALLARGKSEIPLGTVTYPYMMSAAKSRNSSFISGHSHDHDMVLEHIKDIKTGHDIQGISRFYYEEEVLFEPGARLKTTEVKLDPDRHAEDRLLVEKQEV